MSSSINISGGGFPLESYPRGVHLDLFAERLNLVYGKNGSGKSTIGNAVAQYCSMEHDAGLQVHFEPELDAEARKNVFVFNEQYVRDNLLVKKKGPETIAMLGRSSVNTEFEIERLELLIEDLKVQMRPYVEQQSKFVDSKNPESPQYRFKELTNSIKSNGYTQREFQIRQILSNAPKQPSVVEGVVQTIEASPEYAKQASLTDSVSELQSLFEQKLTLLRNAGGADSLISWIRPDVSVPFDVTELSRVLAQEVLKPELSDREKRIFKLFDDNERVSYFRQTRNDLLFKRASACPLCHQDISDTQYGHLEQAISRLLDEEADRCTRRLNEIRESIVDFVLAKPALPEGLYTNELNNLENAILKWNNLLDDVRKALEDKACNIFEASAFKLDPGMVSSLVTSLNTALDVIAQCVAQYNSDIAKKAELKKDLTLINNYLSWLLSKDKFEAYNMALRLKADADDRVKDIDNQIKSLDERKRSLSTKSDFAPACDYMNRQLTNIFYSEKRLSLIGTDGGEYILHSRGHAVSPDRISTGERNIMALIYFFASLFKGKVDARRYANPMLVVIDDPISSFDYGNRMGITSFLAMEIENILCGNPDSKVLVLSHEINTVNDLSSLVRRFNSNYNGEPGRWTYYSELCNGKLRGFSYYGDNEYFKLLQDVYYYAAGQGVTESDESGIGNKMRVVLETYSNFMFKCGFKDMLSKNDVLALLPDGTEEIYRSFLGRFIFDALSHAENQVNRLTTFQSRFTEEEKRANAKCVLKFIYYCSSFHLSAYLSERQFWQVKDWADEECQVASAQ